MTRRRILLREALRRLGLTVLVCAMFVGWVVADRLGAHYRATYGHLFTKGEK